MNATDQLPQAMRISGRLKHFVLGDVAVLPQRVCLVFLTCAWSLERLERRGRLRNIKGFRGEDTYVRMDYSVQSIDSKVHFVPLTKPTLRTGSRSLTSRHPVKGYLPDSPD